MTERQLLQDQYLSHAWTTVAWGGMLCFFIFGVSLFITRSDVAFLLMGASIAVWITAGIVVIRIKRREAKIVTHQYDLD